MSLTFLLLAALLNNDKAVVSAAHIGRVWLGCTPTGGLTKEIIMIQKALDWLVVSGILFVCLVVPRLIEGVL